MQRLALWGVILAGTSVALGAFGAHWLESAVADWGLSGEEQLRRLETWEVAVRYQMYHGLALLVLGLWRTPSRAASVAAVLFTLGISIFSGCLYALVLSGIKVLGAIVPLGGALLIAGWIAAAFAVRETKTSSSHAV